MDWSDEQKHQMGELCYCSPENGECADHTCIREDWSCGDGQCITGENRFGYAKKRTMYCESMRDLNFICESSADWQLWTQSNGLCWNEPGYDDPEDMNDNSLFNSEKCQYLIRCALSRGFERDCPCNGTNCFQVMTSVCEKDVMYQYPNGRLLTPYILNLYNWNRSWDNSAPDKFKLSGSIKCRGFHGISTDYIFLYERVEYFRPFPLIDYLLCIHPNVNRDVLSSIQYSNTCWNDFFSLNHQSYAFADVFGQQLSDLICNQQNKDDCRFLKEYISFDSETNSTDSAINNTWKQVLLPFRSYYDTFWNLPLHLDESPQRCQQWVCQHDQYQYHTGQCIALNWVYDEEWDCLDASDEQAIFLIQLSSHNRKIPGLQYALINARRYVQGNHSRICVTLIQNSAVFSLT
jgi:hypothetical protein